MAKEKEKREAFEDIDDIIGKEFNDLIDMSSKETEISHWYSLGNYALNYICSKNINGAIPKGRVIGIDGLSGCVYDDTIIEVNKSGIEKINKYTIKELYNLFHKNSKSNVLNTLSFKSDAIGHNEIEDVIDSGEKECFELLTNEGNSIIVSEEHPFKVPDRNIGTRGIIEKDNFVALKDLLIGEVVMIKDDNVIKNKSFGINYSWENIKSIESVGIKHTYDIRMKKPYSNFVANNFVVHNTGKSLLAAVAMKDPEIDYVIIIESEGGGNSRELINFAGVDPRKIRTFKCSTFKSFKTNKKTNKIEEIADYNLPKKKVTDTYVYTEGAISFIRRFVNSVKFNNISADKNILIIMDSLGNMQSVRSSSGGIDMGKRGQDLNQFFGCFDNEFESSGLTFIFTNKLYQTFDQYNPYRASGGESPIYNPSLSIRLTTTADGDDVEDSEMKKEKEERKTALGSSIKQIKAKIMKSRFGTEMRSIPFLLDFGVGVVKWSGMFRLLKDFGVIKVPSMGWYTMPGHEKNGELIKFRKKDFYSILSSDDDEKWKKIFQEGLETREKELKAERSKFIEEPIDISELEREGDEIISDEDSFGFDEDTMKAAMIQEVEG